jgi:hypothetical protein
MSNYCKKSLKQLIKRLEDFPVPLQYAVSGADKLLQTDAASTRYSHTFRVRAVGKQCRWTVSISQRYWTNPRVEKHVCQGLSLRPSSLSTLQWENILRNCSVTENTRQYSTPNLTLSSSEIYRTTPAVLTLRSRAAYSAWYNRPRCFVGRKFPTTKGRMFAFADLEISASSVTISAK